jgi:hypothetical protein
VIKVRNQLSINDRKVTTMTAITELVKDSVPEPAGFSMLVAQRLEEVASGTAEEIRSVVNDLSTAFQLLLAHVRPEVRHAISGLPNSDESLRHGFLLGQAAFAQGFAEQLAHRRAASNFGHLIKDPKFLRYVAALFNMDLNNAAGETG